MKAEKIVIVLAIFIPEIEVCSCTGNSGKLNNSIDMKYYYNNL